MQGELTTLEKVITFIFGGRSLFTLVSKKTGKHLVFQVKKDKKNFKLFYVWSRVPDPKNSRHITMKYLGMIVYDHMDNIFRKTKKSVGIEGDLHFRSFTWYWNILNKEKRLPTNVTIHHHGRCSVCGRKLIDPESIERGMGKVCWKRTRERYF